MYSYHSVASKSGNTTFNRLKALTERIGLVNQALPIQYRICCSTCFLINILNQ